MSKSKAEDTGLIPGTTNFFRRLVFLMEKMTGPHFRLILTSLPLAAQITNFIFKKSIFFYLLNDLVQDTLLRVRERSRSDKSKVRFHDLLILERMLYHCATEAAKDN